MALRVGILGAGYMGTTHANILARDQRVKVTALADTETARAEALAPKVGAKAVASLQALLDAGVEALFITTPNTTHTEPVLTALKAGVHVFSEKPMATSLAEADQIREAAARGPGLYQVGHNRRFAPAYRAAKARLADGSLHVTSAHIKMNRGELQQPPWVGDRAVTGGFLYESTIHLLDMARWLLGEVAWVQVVGGAHVYREPDDFSMLLGLASGIHAAFTSCAHSTWLFPFERVELFGAHAALVTEEMDRVQFAPGLGKPVETQEFGPLAIPEKWGYAEEDRLFVEAVLTRGTAPVTAEDGYRSVELVEACYRSLELRERITLPLS
ncbi:MAG TPA: Gfo/Idh/MocA family oxidoreductase [Candidatus Methylomirabilis sp.]|nr:Gfo/Idh/MocA family oxidoreductase [Candidatus Methylomirabilis sp.]